MIRPESAHASPGNSVWHEPPGNGSVVRNPRGRLKPLVQTFAPRLRWVAACPCLLVTVACLCLIRVAPVALAQPFDATNLHKPTDLAATWLVHAGDDTAYARPDFDDSQWLPLPVATRSLRDLFAQTRPEVVWYRLHLKVAPVDTGLALQASYLASAFEIYSNGVKLLQVGQVAPFVAYDANARLPARIPEAQIQTGAVVIALRLHIGSSDWGFPYVGLLPSMLALGEESVLRDRTWLGIIGGNDLSWLSALIYAALSLGGLLLYRAQRRQREYLWNTSGRHEIGRKG